MKFIALLFVLSCQTTNASKPSESVASNHFPNDSWATENIDEVFAKAKDDQSLVFLYWGAKWCPPCAEIKNQVLTKPAFAELTKSVQLVYIDGDHAQAQTWSDELKVSGYPTLLLLDSNKRELMRLSAALQYDEFSAVFKNAVAKSKPITEVVDLALSGTAKKDDWQLLAYYSWEQFRDADWKDDEKLDIFIKLTEAVPENLVKERALIASQLLSFAGELNDSKDKQVLSRLTKIKARSESYLEMVFKDSSTILAARYNILYSTKGVFSLLGKAPTAKKYEKIWLDAATLIEGTPTLSTDTRLWSVYPELNLYRLKNPKAKTVPKLLKAKIVEAVRTADSRAKSENDRRSVISGAAYLLGEVNEFEEAKKLLITESKITKTPWYYYSSLASVSEKSGNKKEALEWSKKARTTAKGSATKLQWIVSDLKRVVKLSSDLKATNVAELMKEFYSSAFALDDGFSGRNARGFSSIAKSVKELKTQAPIKSVVASYAAKCQTLAEENRKFCDGHFKDML